MELVILGSGGAIPVKNRNLPAVALKFTSENTSEIILFDCGEDVQRRFVDVGLKFNKPLKILITHFHGDHIIGLPGLLFHFGLADREAPISIYGPRNLFLYLYLHKKILGLKTPYPTHIFEIDNEKNLLIEFEGLDSEVPKREIKLVNNILHESKYYFLKFAPVNHSVITFAYSFVEKPLPGEFNKERAQELGIPPSRLYKNLQKGQPIVHEGKTIDPIKEGIVGPKRPGKIVTYSGDTAPCDSLIELGKHSDVLIHEATYSKELEALAKEKKHSTSVDAAIAAQKMEAKQLILIHISSRYEGDASILLTEAKEIFPNTILSSDSLEIKL